MDCLLENRAQSHSLFRSIDFAVFECAHLICPLFLPSLCPACSFFKNGQSLGVAFRNVSEDRLFPCVGLRTKDEEVYSDWAFLIVIHWLL